MTVEVNLDERDGRRDPNERAWWEGWWETQVSWLEVSDDEDSEELTQYTKTFYSEEERTKFLEERVQGGYVFDILWTWETSLGGEGHPDQAKLSVDDWDIIMYGDLKNTSPTVSEDHIQVV